MEPQRDASDNPLRKAGQFVTRPVIAFCLIVMVI
jgi:hypothetical protein